MNVGRLRAGLLPEPEQGLLVRRGYGEVVAEATVALVTLFLGAGANPKIVQEMLGNSSITVTLDIYSHDLPTIQAEPVRRPDLLRRIPTWPRPFRAQKGAGADTRI